MPVSSAVRWKSAPARKTVIHLEKPAFSTIQYSGSKKRPTRTASRRKYIYIQNGFDFCEGKEASDNMDTNIRNAINKINAEFNYNLEMEISRTPFQPFLSDGVSSSSDAWYAKIYNTEGVLEVEFLERDGGVIASVLHRFNFTTARVVQIMDVLMEFMPTAPPGGD